MLGFKHWALLYLYCLVAPIDVLTKKTSAFVNLFLYMIFAKKQLVRFFRTPAYNEHIFHSPMSSDWLSVRLISESCENLNTFETWYVNRWQSLHYVKFPLQFLSAPYIPHYSSIRQWAEYISKPFWIKVNVTLEEQNKCLSLRVLFTLFSTFTEEVSWNLVKCLALWVNVQKA